MNLFSYPCLDKACLAQSPQLHKQMAICADFPRVFEIGTKPYEFLFFIYTSF
jgi:aspartyl/asparaginyl-tRNA synthetase